MITYHAGSRIMTNLQLSSFTPPCFLSFIVCNSLQIGTAVHSRLTLNSIALEAVPCLTDFFFFVVVVVFLLLTLFVCVCFDLPVTFIALGLGGGEGVGGYFTTNHCTLFNLNGIYSLQFLS